MFHIFFVLMVPIVLANSPPLHTYNVDRGMLSVSGISSGACMATQLHVIYSSKIMGVGMVAGVPFACAGGNIATATSCMKTPSLESPALYESQVSTGAFLGRVDSTYHLSNDKVFIFHGSRDSVVNPGNGEKIKQFYRHYTSSSENIKTVYNITAEHSMPTENFGGLCSVLSKTDFMNNCGYNAAYEILNFIYGGGLQKPTGDTTLAGQLLSFDQKEFFHFSPAIVYSFANSGYIYVPSGCVHNKHKCKLHVALHGCQMGRDRIGDTYAKHAGYNEVGELNDIIILYPQATHIATNPNGCWDWWGYTGIFYATKSGFQITALQRMMERVMGDW